METAVLQKNRLARNIGMGFFLVLAGLFTAAELFVGNFSFLIFVPLALVLLPVVINRRAGYLAFASVSILLSAYMTLAILVKAVGFWQILIPSIVAFLGVIASVLVFYSCLSISERSFRF